MDEFGDENSSKKIVEILKDINSSEELIQKQITC